MFASGSPIMSSVAEVTASKKSSTRKKASKSGGASAEQMASRQREISVSEFFAKNRHLLGFDNPRKAMLTTVKEAVDNALDACEEAKVLPDIRVEILQLSETRFKITVRDNGPGIVRKQIENIFGKLLYGSKFHRMKMSRGQQGIGISAAGMYGLMTTGQPVVIITKTGRRKPAHEVILKMDTSKNRADVVSETEHPEVDHLFKDGHGTQVSIELEGRFLKGKQSIGEYLEQTAIANPHASITYVTPSSNEIEFPRAVDELPLEPTEIKPHPKGIELGTLIQMLERTQSTKLGAFFKNEFCRVGPNVAKEICSKAGLTDRTWIKAVEHQDAEKLYDAIQKVRIMSPPTNCLVPIGSKSLLAGLLKEVRAEFFTATCRPPAVYRGNPFQIEVGLAYGGSLPGDDHARILRFANRVPLLYQQSACCSFKAAIEASWKNYGLTQPRGSVPVGPMVIMIHMASVWVPFTSESKEAIADYDEIRKEMKLALQECGRKLGTYIRRRQKMRRESDRRSVFERYIGEIARGCESITGSDAKLTYDALLALAEKKTAEADQVLDDEGRVVEESSRLARDEDVVILDEARPGEGEHEEDLFGGAASASTGSSAASRTSRKKAGASRTRAKRTRRK